MNLSKIKQYLRVDFDADDDFIMLLWEAAKEYVKNAAGGAALNVNGSVAEEKPLVQLLELCLISTMYENRSYTISANEKVQYTINSIVRQLEYGGDD